VSRPATFIPATDYDDSPFPSSCDRARARGWKSIAMPCGHDVMLDRPAELAGALLDVAED
jgi:hypothetical protein